MRLKAEAKVFYRVFLTMKRKEEKREPRQKKTELREKKLFYLK